MRFETEMQNKICMEKTDIPTTRYDWKKKKKKKN